MPEPGTWIKDPPDPRDYIYKPPKPLAMGMGRAAIAQSPTYAGGSYVGSENSGVAWSLNLTEDMMFEEWGNPIVSGWTHIATDKGIAAASIATVNGQATTMATINGVAP